MKVLVVFRGYMKVRIGVAQSRVWAKHSLWVLGVRHMVCVWVGWGLLGCFCF